LVGCTGRPTWTYSNGDLSIRVHDVHRVTTCRPGRRHIVAASRLQLALFSYGCCSSLKYYKFTTTTDHLTVLRMYVNHETAAVPPQTPLQELTAPPPNPRSWWRVGLVGPSPRTPPTSCSRPFGSLCSGLSVSHPSFYYTFQFYCSRNMSGCCVLHNDCICLQFYVNKQSYYSVSVMR